jgi:hypothetical protein
MRRREESIEFNPSEYSVDSAGTRFTMVSQAIENRNSLPSRLSITAAEKKQPTRPLSVSLSLSQNNSSSSQQSQGGLLSALTGLDLMSQEGGGGGGGDLTLSGHSPLHTTSSGHSQPHLQPLISEERYFNDQQDELMIPVSFDTSQV